MRKGRTSAELPVLGDDPEYWTVYEFSMMLGPPFLNTVQVRHLIRLCDIQPAGRKRAGPRAKGRYPLVYKAIEVIRAYENVYQSIPKK